ncbi:MAG: hypothetical protein OEL78_09740 [Hyphomicrobiales bacterium]|nr:hypothetical protein [Hyphomicrobiales bacterium]
MKKPQQDRLPAIAAGASKQTLVQLLSSSHPRITPRQYIIREDCLPCNLLGTIVRRQQ